MKKQLKKGIAILTAGVLLTTSAAAYAAQLPGENGKEPLLSSSSGYNASATIELDSYQLTSDRIIVDCDFKLGGYDVQYRSSSYNYFIEVEEGPGTSNFVKVYENNGAGLVPGIRIDQPISIKEGERVHVQVYLVGYAFHGYTPVGHPSDKKDFYFML